VGPNNNEPPTTEPAQTKNKETKKPKAKSAFGSRAHSPLKREKRSGRVGYCMCVCVVLSVFPCSANLPNTFVFIMFFVYVQWGGYGEDCTQESPLPSSSYLQRTLLAPSFPFLQDTTAGQCVFVCSQGRVVLQSHNNGFIVIRWDIIVARG
jgi:hypothetical protein